VKDKFSISYKNTSGIIISPGHKRLNL
ncbi:unnamed protein product, partial [Allacma fusca]